MTYQETIEWLFSQLPMFQRQGKPAFKKDLTNIKLLCEKANHPEQRFKSIHIAGTNGKGSVSHILASVLQTAGYKTGLYTSPHLKDFRERIKINGKMISEQEVVDYVETYMNDFIRIKPSFFEMSVAMAFDHFSKHGVDIAVVEVGLGGRLDSTNILQPLISVITNISFDHMQFLGDSLKEIAVEKAGIIKAKTPVVIGEKQDEVQDVFLKRSEELQAPLYFAEDSYQLIKHETGEDLSLSISLRGKDNSYEELHTDIQGSYQIKNIITALKTIDLLPIEFIVKKQDIYNGLGHVKSHTDFKGRWYVMASKPLIIADTGHNIEGIRQITRQLEQLQFEQLHIVFGVVNDKNTDTILDLMPQNAVYYFTKADIPRAFDENLLRNKALEKGLIGDSYRTTESALKSAKENAAENDMILICGSTFIVAELI
jgi:dihydrofolate synthase/folylpolyglutamate synthase